jgi:molybdopterin-guanine dinucleotide biosynthesis protein B
VLGIVGRPNNGKTTLIEKLIPELTARGLRVGAVKRVAKFDIDVPGKDSWRHSRAGAEAYAVGSPGSQTGAS